MKKLGISIYPQKASFEKNLEYLENASKFGFTRLFVALLGAEPSQEGIRRDYGPILKRAKELGFEVSCDVNGEVIKAVCGEGFFGNFDLTFFKEMGVDIIRFDMGMSEMEEAFFIRNKFGIKVELNMSMEIDHVAGVLAMGAPKEKVMGCHNYYPHNYTGLSLDYFNRCTAIWTKHNLRTAAFISTQSNEKYGPWPICDGLPTLEMHRNLPITTQLKHYVGMGTIDDVLIGDAFASIDELEKLSKINKNTVSLEVDLAEGLSDTYKNILRMPLSRRPDTNDYIIRSIEGRLFLRKEDIQPFNTVDIKRGDILIENNLYGQYKGEVQIALKDMKNSGRTNVVGHIKDFEVFLIDTIKPGQSFSFDI
jgi:uncharacterized protein